MKYNQIILVCLLIAVAILPAFAAEKPLRFKIKTVKIDGNHAYTDRRLHRVIVSKPSILFNPVYYYEEILSDDIAGLELFYRHNGYLNAKVVDYSVKLDSAKHRADIKIRVFEGELTRVEGLSIFENTVFSDAKLLKLIPLKPNDPLRRDAIDDGTLAILTLCADNGFLEATATPEIRIDSLAHLAQIDYFIHENTQYSLDSIIYKGLVKTQLKVVSREMEFQKGEIVNYSRLLKSQRNLYLTGLFQSAFVRPVAPVSGEVGKKDALIEVKENKSREYNFSIGYGTVEQVRAGVALYNTNWRGSAQKLGLAVKLSFIETGFEASFSEPWTFDTRWRTDIAFSMDYLIDPSYEQRTVGGRITVGRALLHQWSTNLTYRHENIDLLKVKIESQPDVIRSHIRSLKLKFSHDTRDNLFNPNSGLYLEQSVETAGLFRAASESFTRVIIIGRYFNTVKDGTVFASGLELAWMDSPRGFNSILYSERLFAGGPSSIRAFKYKRAGPLDVNGYPLGGGFKAVWNAAEIRQSLYKVIDGVVFLDVGNVWNSAEAASIGGIRLSPGVGLRVNTSLGLFRVDYGYNVKPRGSESTGMFYFSVGQAF